MDLLFTTVTDAAGGLLVAVEPAAVLDTDVGDRGSVTVLIGAELAVVTSVPPVLLIVPDAPLDAPVAVATFDTAPEPALPPVAPQPASVAASISTPAVRDDRRHIVRCAAHLQFSGPMNKCETIPKCADDDDDSFAALGAKSRDMT